MQAKFESRQAVEVRRQQAEGESGHKPKSAVVEQAEQADLGGNQDQTQGGRVASQVMYHRSW